MPDAGERKQDGNQQERDMKRLLRRIIGDSPAYERMRYRRKIRQMRRRFNIPARPLDPSIEHQATTFWSAYGMRLDLAWHRAYMAVHPVPDAFRYIPEDIYYAHIQRALVRYDLAEAYADKNSYDRLFPQGTALPVLLRVMNGRCHDADYHGLSWSDAASLLHRQNGAFIIKPSIGSGDGLGVRRFEVDDGHVILGDRRTDLERLRALYRDDFLVQPVFIQHPSIAAFHPSSVNTIRLYTVRLDDEIIVMSAVLRMGDNGRCKDNRGIPCGILAQGRLTDRAVTQKFQVLSAHPATGKPFKGFIIPGWNNAQALVRRLHERLAYFDAIGWDITIAPDETPYLMELNLTYPEINFLQANNGPLFGTRTEAVLDQVFGPRQPTTVSIPAPATG